MSRTILIVDDNAINRELVAVVMQHMGLHYLEATDGSEALQLTLFHRPELVICDILMPTMDGYEFVHHLRSDPDIANTKVIFYTAYYHESEAQRLASSLGILQVLTKPCTPEDIIKAVQQALSGESIPEAMEEDVEFDQEHLRLLTDKLAEKADGLQHASLKLSALTDLNLRLASEWDPDSLIRQVCHGVRDLIGAKYGFACIKVKNNGLAIHHYSSGIDQDEVRELDSPDFRNRFFSDVINQRKPKRKINPSGIPEKVGLPAGYPAVHNIVVAPIVSLHAVYGWICLVDKLGADEFSAEEERLLSISAAQTGRIYENGSLYRQVQLRASELADEVEERKIIEQKILRLNRVHAMLSSINGLIVHTRDRQELFQKSCRIATKSGHISFAYIVIFAADNEALDVWSCVEDDEIDSVKSSLEDFLNDAGTKTKTQRDKLYKKKSALVINNIRRSSALFSLIKDKANTRSMALLPLIVADKTVGVFGLEASETDFFDIEEMKLLNEMVADIAFALDHIDKAEKLEYIALHDPLTRLPNRTLFLDHLAQGMAMAKRNQSKIAVLIMNIDRFRLINDSLGRAAGDELLKQIAGRFQPIVSELDLISFAQLGGDSYGFLMADVVRLEEVAHHIEVILNGGFDEPFHIGGEELRIPAKIGVAIYPDDGELPDTLLRHAEIALKSAKVENRQYMLHDRRMNERLSKLLSLENQLRRAIENSEFVLYYQPKVALDDYRILGMEALIRWQHPKNGLIPPNEFISLLEDTGLIVQVGEWVLEQVKLDFEKWSARGIDVPRIAVNVSAIQMRGGGFIEVLKQTVLKGPHRPKIDIEITESVIMSNIEDMVEKLKVIKSLGIEIAIDDFGTGYSSLAYLTHLPVSVIKIDRSFIITMLEDINTMALVTSIITLAHTLGKITVAEGVELDKEAETLRKLGCGQMQGYLFSKPLSFEDMSRLMEDRR